MSHIPTNSELSKLKTVLCYDGYMTPVNPNNGFHCIGASYDRENLNREFDPVAQQVNGDKLRKCVPEQSWPHQVDTSGNQSRQGIRCVSRDHLPFIGSVGDLDKTKQVYHNLQTTKLEDAEKAPSYPNLFLSLIHI